MSGVFGDPDYALRWPPRIFREEIERLIRRGHKFGIHVSAWQHEVATLLGQACSSVTPRDDFARCDPHSPLSSWEHPDRGVPEGVRRQLSWLGDLAAAVDQMPRARKPAPYWSARPPAGGAVSSVPSSSDVARQVRELIQMLQAEHYFAKYLGFACVDDNADPEARAAEELEHRVGRGHLWSLDPATWDENDLCDFIEVFHDLAARPTAGEEHSFNECGWHPSGFDQTSGQALYRWRINELLEETALGLRLADEGEDVGRMVRVAAGDLDRLVTDILRQPTQSAATVAHAVALFRDRNGGREGQRLAVFALHRILEGHRCVLKDHLWSRDEAALFKIANEFDIRHNTDRQLREYDDAFLEWIFYWYLATVQLLERIEDTHGVVVPDRSDHNAD